MTITYANQYEGDYLEAAHLGSETSLTVSEVVAKNTTKAKDGRVIDKPIIKFKEAKRGLILNKTNAKILALMFGANMESYIDERVTLYPTTCEAFGKKNTPCIRIKLEQK